MEEDGHGRCSKAVMQGCERDEEEGGREEGGGRMEVA